MDGTWCISSWLNTCLWHPQRIKLLYWMLVEHLAVALKWLTSYLMLGEQPHAFHLVERWVVCCVNLISSVHIPHHQKRIKSWTHQLALVCWCVCSQHIWWVDVVAFWWQSADMILWHKKAVKVLFQRHNRTERVIDREYGVATSIDIVVVEEVFNSLAYEVQWVMLSSVQVLTQLVWTEEDKLEWTSIPRLLKTESSSDFTSSF